MVLSKKYYIEIAKLIQEARSDGDSVEDFAVKLAGYFGSDNGRFDESRFLEACGIKR